MLQVIEKGLRGFAMGTALADEDLNVRLFTGLFGCGVSKWAGQNAQQEQDEESVHDHDVAALQSVN
jgi:hypothetical protein